MATKTPAKGKKASTPKEKAPKRAPKAVKAATDDDEAPEGGGDEDEDDDDLDLATPAKPVAKKPAAAAANPRTSGEPAAVVPARRLTPEAKAKVNEMVAKGMPLGEALKVAASWETFVAPVKDEPAKLVQGKSFDGQPRPRPAAKEDDESDGPE